MNLLEALLFFSHYGNWQSIATSTVRKILHGDQDDTTWLDMAARERDECLGQVYILR